MPKPKDETQRAKFEEAARQLGCDEDEAAFEERLRRIGNAKPNTGKTPKARKPGR